MGNQQGISKDDINVIIDSSNLKLKEPLGEGSLGKVYRAEWTSATGTQVVAAKKLKTVTLKQEDVEYLCRIQDKNVNGYLGMVVSPAILVTELGANGTLFDFLRKQRPKGRLQASQICTWMLHVCSAVKFVQKLSGVQADVKSPNYVISFEHVLKLCDLQSASEPLSKSPPENKIKWMAPELYVKKIRVPKSDVYSCGIVFREILTCEPPWERMSKGDVHLKVGGSRKLRPVIPNDVDDTLRDLLTECWKEDPDARPDIAAVKKRVKKIIAKGCNICKYLYDLQITGVYWGRDALTTL